MRLRRARHGADHGGQRAGLSVQPALPEAAARPCLQHCHADEQQRRGRPGSAGRAGRTASAGAAARSAGRPRSRTAAAPGAPNRNVRPGAKIPPKASPKTQTTRPQPALTSPASLDDQPAGAAISHAPMPSWIHTAAAPAWIGWNDQAVPAQLTTCWTQTGELAAVGWITCAGQAGGHGRLRLQDPVEDPEDAEADPQQPPAAGSVVPSAQAERGCRPATTRQPCGRRPATRAAPSQAEPEQQQERRARSGPDAAALP